MAKCIILSRVSTSSQSYDEQEKQLFELAISNGFNEDEIIAIAEKESGIKLKEDERKGLNRMKQYIEKDDSINTVFINQIDRLSRRKAVLFSIVEWLQERHIQLIVRDPYLKMFNDNGTMNDMADIVFGLFASLAESEMRVKKERFKRSKDANKLIGKYNGGGIPLGYKLDENNLFVIDEDKAEIVKLIFKLFTEDYYSICRIQREILKLGINKSVNGIRTILNNKNYIGCGISKTDAIIDNETFYKADSILAKHERSVSKSKYKTLCNGLIICKCGSKYTVDRNRYCCMGHYNEFTKKQKCDNYLTIECKELDRIVWQNAATIYSDEISGNVDNTIKQKTKEKDILLKKLNVINNKLNNIESKKDNIINLYVDGIISKDKMNEKIKAIDDSKIELDVSKIDINSNIIHIDNIIKSLNNKDELQLMMKTFDSIFETNHEEMFNIVHKVIDHIEITGTMAVKIVSIYNKNGTILTIKYRWAAKKSPKWFDEEISFPLNIAM